MSDELPEERPPRRLAGVVVTAVGERRAVAGPATPTQRVKQLGVGYERPKPRKQPAVAAAGKRRIDLTRRGQAVIADVMRGDRPMIANAASAPMETVGLVYVGAFRMNGGIRLAAPLRAKEKPR